MSVSIDKSMQRYNGRTMYLYGLSVSPISRYAKHAFTLVQSFRAHNLDSLGMPKLAVA